MSEEDTGAGTEEATQAGAETGEQPDTNDDTTQGITFTQADVDSRISLALKKQAQKNQAELDKQRQQDEKIALMNEGKFEDLYKSTQAEIDTLKASMAAKDYRNEAQAILVKLNMSHFADTLIPGTQTIDELLQKAEAFKAGMDQHIKSGIDLGVKERLDTGKSPIPESNHATKPAVIGNLTREEWVEHKKANGLV